MAVASSADCFAAGLERLQRVHDHEVNTLRADISRLQARLDGPDFTPVCAVSRPSLVRFTSGVASLSNISSLASANHAERISATPTTRSKPRARISITGDDRDEAEEGSFLVRIATHPKFDAFFAGLILVNFAMIAVEAQYAGMDLGTSQGLRPGLQTPVDEMWPHAFLIFNVTQWMFGILFATEIVLKIVALRCACWKDPMNWLDFCVVILWVASVSGVSLAKHSQAARCLRLVKLVRLMRIARKAESFDALWLLTSAIRGSVVTLAWAMIVFAALLSLFALVMCQVLTIFYFSDLTQPLKERQELWIYFGTFARALFTMFELTFANWPPVSRLLAEQVHIIFMLFAVLYKLTVGFMILGVVNGVFMQETFKAASLDDSIMIRQKARAAAAHKAKMEKLFEVLDSDGDGTLTYDEVGDIMEDPELKHWLGSMEFPVVSRKDLRRLMAEIDVDGNGQIEISELSEGFSRLKGAARSWDLLDLKQLMHQMLRLLTTTSSGQAEMSSPQVLPGQVKDGKE